mmetsp:Transcript_28523/g.37317  ORF Transcript_28523/g.37317 Transcript_28523/m.37317 type:complete len:85 (-) Transcript_28523:207-461(-)
MKGGFPEIMGQDPMLAHPQQQQQHHHNSSPNKPTTNRNRLDTARVMQEWVMGHKEDIWSKELKGGTSPTDDLKLVLLESRSDSK